MIGNSSKQLLQSLQRKWNRWLALAYALLAVALIAAGAAIANAFLPVNGLLFFLIATVLFSLCIYTFYKQKLAESDVVIFLNHTCKSIEESAHLMAKPYSELTFLERIQVARIEGQIPANIATPKRIKQKTKRFALLLLSALMLVSFSFFIPLVKHSSGTKTETSGEIKKAAKPETKLPEIKEVTIVIRPPFYTAKALRQQDKFNITAEQKSIITWTLTTSQKVKDVQLLFNDKSILHLHKINNERKRWTISKAITTSGFYQVLVDGKSSQLYTFDMIPDVPPVIQVKAPQVNTFIKLGEEKKVAIQVFLSDDYGLDSAYINATTASGSGEAVTFKQLTIPFANFKKGRQNEVLQKQLNISALGMGDGDELYFYITAKDNAGQAKRSDVYIVRLEDSSQLMSLAGMANGLDIKPELFRSERQIIIETEQLLKDKDTLSETGFKEKSNDLGTDQQLLRLRYGKYLGEETQSEINPSINNSQGNDASDFGNAAKVIDEYSDKHDATEDADFFDAATKKQLQAMLTEMWKASLQLKTAKPKEALPYEYNALRLLKDLQQKTRAYVAKTGVQTAPLNVNKRLSGELDKIIQPSLKQNVQANDSSLLKLRKALGVLEKIRSGEVIETTDNQLLKDVGTQLSHQVALQPSQYLQAYQAFQKIIENKPGENDITLTGKAFQKMIQTTLSRPQSAVVAPDMNLSQHYFRSLQHPHD